VRCMSWGVGARGVRRGGEASSVDGGACPYGGRFVVDLSIDSRAHNTGRDLTNDGSGIGRSDGGYSCNYWCAHAAVRSDKRRAETDERAQRGGGGSAESVQRGDALVVLVVVARDQRPRLGSHRVGSPASIWHDTGAPMSTSIAGSLYLSRGCDPMGLSPPPATAGRKRRA
jgi:hypothetical protein